MTASDEPKPGLVAGPPPPAELPEPRERVDDWPRWPAWYGPVALLTGLLAYSVVLVILEGILRSAGVSSKSPAATDVLTVIQDVVFVATAVAFASMTARPRAWQFGVRGRPLAPTARWAALTFVSYWAVWVIYTVAFSPHGKQSVTKDLGANSSTAALIGGALVVIVVVPIAEELFFRGFLYRALRTRFNLWAAAAIDGAIFGVVHYTGTSTLAVLPLLAVLGFLFCLAYERTGTIYTTIALHALNNAIAYGAGTHHGAAVSAALGAAMVGACAVALVRTPPGREGPRRVAAQGSGSPG
jgi:uncharacterized protein